MSIILSSYAGMTGRPISLTLSFGGRIKYRIIWVDEGRGSNWHFVLHLIRIAQIILTRPTPRVRLLDPVNLARPGSG